MNCYDISGRLGKLRNIAKNTEKRQKLLEKINIKGHKLKRAITIGTLALMLINPSVAHASNPIEFESERLENNTLEEIIELVNQGEVEVYSDDLKKGIGCYSLIEFEPPFKIDINSYEFPIKLLSTEGQQAVIDFIEEQPLLEEISINRAIPFEMIGKIMDAGEGCKFSISESEHFCYSNANDYVNSSDVIIIYDVKDKTRLSDGQLYRAADVNRFFCEKSIADLGEDQLAYLSIDTYRECEKNEGLNSQGEVCIPILSVKEISTEEAINLNGRVDYIQIKFPGRNLHEMYTIDEYIEISKAIDDITSKINPKSSDFEKALAIYCEIGKDMKYEETDNSDIYGGMIEKKGVCLDISKCYRAVCQRVGLEAEYITGFNEGALVGHAWNQVKINGKWVDVDLTGDLKNIQAGEQPMSFGNLQIDYDQMSENHHSNPEERAVINQKFVTTFFELRKRNVNKHIDYDRGDVR